MNRFNYNIDQIKQLLHDAAVVDAAKAARFFKTDPGSYAEHDQFIGVSVPHIRSIAKKFFDISLADLEILLQSKINEERLCALIMLVSKYKKADEVYKEEMYQFYLKNMQYVNNWNLVDSSAHLIMGAYFFDKNRDVLLQLAASTVMWERRIAIVATWYFIQQNDLAWTFLIAKMLLQDQHDLIHKSVGWMLREAGKKDEVALIGFLDLYATNMPRTCLRYAIEKFSHKQRIMYLMLK